MCQLSEILKRNDIPDDLRASLEECLIQSEVQKAEQEKIKESLEQAVKDLEKTNYEKDKFFSVIAHDLKGPLGNFMGFSALLMEDYETMTLKNLKEIAGCLNSSSENLYKLLENLLEWSRTRTGKMKVDIQKIDLHKSFMDIASSLNEPAKSKGIELVPEVTDLTVDYDPNMLASILRNLTSNAIKFCSEGDKVTISAKLFEAYVEVCVADSGIGMSQEIMAGLFVPGSGVQRKGTNGEPSTGLGLLLCKEFVELHGGIISVLSQKGTGSSFYFTIPILPETKV